MHDPETRETDLLDAAAAADVLGVPPDRIDVLVSQGLLTPVEVPGAQRFLAAEVEALRLQGA